MAGHGRQPRVVDGPAAAAFSAVPDCRQGAGWSRHRLRRPFAGPPRFGCRPGLFHRSHRWCRGRRSGRMAGPPAGQPPARTPGRRSVMYSSSGNTLPAVPVGGTTSGVAVRGAAGTVPAPVPVPVLSFVAVLAACCCGHACCCGRGDSDARRRPPRRRRPCRCRRGTAAASSTPGVPTRPPSLTVPRQAPEA